MAYTRFDNNSFFAEIPKLHRGGVRMNDTELQNGINELIKYIEIHYHLHVCEHIIENGNVIIRCVSKNKNIVLNLLRHTDAIRVFPNQSINKKDQEDRRELILEIESQLS